MCFLVGSFLRRTTGHPVSHISRLLTEGLNLMYCFVGRALDLELSIHGAPNFRAPKEGNLNVFGVAQPRTQGLRGILSVLRCRPNTPNPTHVIWFSTREEPVGTELLICLVLFSIEATCAICCDTKSISPDVHSYSVTPQSRDGR